MLRLIFLGLSLILINILLYEFSYDFIPIGIIVVMIIVPLTGILTLILQQSEANNTLKTIVKYLFFISLISFTVFIFTARLQNRINSQNANKLILQIEKYRKDKGQYPENLDLLSPEYLNKVLKTWTGLFPKDFIYEFANKVGHESKYYYYLHYQTDYFLIGYDGYGGAFSCYDCKSNEWHYDD